MAHWDSNGHVTDDVTWRRKVKFVTSIYLWPNISKTDGDRDFGPLNPNRKWPIGIWMVSWLTASRDPERSRSWPQYILGPLSRQRLVIRSYGPWSYWSTYRKWLLGIKWSRKRWRHETLNGQIVTFRDPKVQDWYQFVFRFQRPHKWKWKCNNVGFVTMRLFTTSPCHVTKIGNKTANINAKNVVYHTS